MSLKNYRFVFGPSKPHKHTHTHTKKKKQEKAKEKKRCITKPIKELLFWKHEHITETTVILHIAILNNRKTKIYNLYNPYEYI